MANIAGFVIGSALASDLPDEQRMRMGLVGSLMPSPLVGALVVESIIESEKADGERVDEQTALEDVAKRIRRISDAVEQARTADEREAQERLIATLELVLAEVRADAAWD